MLADFWHMAQMIVNSSRVSEQQGGVYHLLLVKRAECVKGRLRFGKKIRCNYRGKIGT